MNKSFHSHLLLKSLALHQRHFILNTLSARMALYQSANWPLRSKGKTLALPQFSISLPVQNPPLIRQWHIGSDARWLLLPVLHPAVIRYRKQKKSNPSSRLAGACSLATAATTSSISSKKKIHTSQIKDGFNTSENSSTNQFVHRRRRRRVQHITNQPIHKSIRTSQTKD